MEDASRVYAAGPTVEYKGRTVFVSPRKRKDYATINAEIIADRKDPFEMIVKAAQELGGNREALGAICSALAENFRSWRNVTWSDYIDFLNTPKGSAMAIWLAIKDNDPDVITFDDVYYYIMSWSDRDWSECWDWQRDVIQKVNQASGTDVLGNSTGPAQESVMGQNQASDKS